MNEEIEKNIAIIQERINNACRKNGRNPGEVKLLLATKTVPADRIIIALKAGYTLIAENKIQEIKEKYEALKNGNLDEFFYLFKESGDSSFKYLQNV